MQRQIQVNDFVHVTQLGLAPSTFVIRQIDNNGIYISPNTDPNSLSLIIPDPTHTHRWKIQGSDAKYDIRFEANNGLARRTISPIQTVRPLSPVQTVRPLSPVQTVRPLSPVQTVRPLSPVQTVRPLSPVQTVRPLSPVQTVRPLSPVQTARTLSTVSPIQTDVVGITGTKDIDIVILAQLDDLSLAQLCVTDRYIATLCEDDELWRNRVVYHFSDADKYKDIGKTWKVYYSELASAMVEHQDFEEEVIVSGANWAAKNGYLNVLEWLYNKYSVLPDSEGIEMAAKYDRLDVLKWMYDHNNRLIYSYYGNIAIPAAGAGHLDILIWLRDEHGAQPEGSSARMAAENGKIHILKWMANFLKFDTSIVDAAASGGHLDILRFMAEHNIYPTFIGATNAFKNDHINVVQWLKQHNIKPTPWMI